MSNSPLVEYIKISPNSNNPRRDTIKKITIHHMAGNLSVEACGGIFANPNRQASSNYGIGSDGRIGMYVEEKNRSWCSSSPWNDHQAITIEVANDGGAPNWHVSDKALASLINLCVDICKRNGIKELNYTGTKDGNLTRHNMLADTLCPGPYLQSKFPYIANEVNKRLNPPKPTPSDKFNIGDKVVINGNLYASSNAARATGKISNKVTNITRKAEGTAHPYNTTDDLGWMNEKDIKLYEEPKPTQKFSLGEKVVVEGNLYVSSNAATPTGRISKRTTYISRYNAGSKHPYNTTGDLGWMDEKDISKYNGRVTYTVKNGDTLSEIAAKYNMSWNQVYAKNKSIIGNNPNVIIPGQVLLIKE